MLKKLALLGVCLVMLVCAGGSVLADETTHGYVYNNWLVPVESPLVYEPNEVFRLPALEGLENRADIEDPQDMFIDKVNGKIYIVDGGKKANCVFKIDIATMQIEETYRGVYFPMSPPDAHKYIREGRRDPLVVTRWVPVAQEPGDESPAPDTTPDADATPTVDATEAPDATPTPTADVSPTATPDATLGADATTDPSASPVPTTAPDTSVTAEPTPEPTPDRTGLEEKFYRLSEFKAPRGIFVDTDGTIYLCEQDNNRVISMDQEGILTGQITKPTESEAIQSDFGFQPQKVVVDKAKTVYVLVTGGNRGAFMFKPSDGQIYMGEDETGTAWLIDGGQFLGFYGANRVQTSMKLMMDYMLKQILPRNLRTSLGEYVPTEMSNMYIDDEGFIYAVTTANNGNLDQVRKLNYQGSNILKYQGASKNFGDLDVPRVDRKDEITQFIDVTVDDLGFITALDVTTARIFQFDQMANTLIIQGKGRAIGNNQVGTSDYPVSIENYGGQIYVLDNRLLQITTYKLTGYGEKLQTAIHLYNEGKYKESLEFWEEVLKRNANCEMAYTGLGRAYMQNDRFEEALNHLRLGYDRKTYSDVYEQYRGVWLADNFSLIVGVLVGVVGAFLLYKNRSKVKKLFSKKEG